MLPKSSKVWLLLAAVAAISAGAVGADAPSRDAPACFEARAKLAFVLDRMDRSCVKDDDCDAYYLAGEACAPPVVLSEEGYARVSNETLLSLQGEVRESCPARLGCAPPSAQPACVERRCIDRDEPSATDPLRTGLSTTNR